MKDFSKEFPSGYIQDYLTAQETPRDKLRDSIREHEALAFTRGFEMAFMELQQVCEFVDSNQAHKKEATRRTLIALARWRLAMQKIGYSSIK